MKKLFLCRWPNRTASVVLAKNVQDAIYLLDLEWDCANPEWLEPIDEFMVDFRLGPKETDLGDEPDDKPLESEDVQLNHIGEDTERLLEKAMGACQSKEESVPLAP